MNQTRGHSSLPKDAEIAERDSEGNVIFLPISRESLTSLFKKQKLEIISYINMFLKFRSVSLHLFLPVGDFEK